MKTTPWIVRRTQAGARLRLFCFAYAGGSANAFLDWQAGLPPTIELCALQLPGRGARFHEAPLATMAPLVENLADVVASHSDLPFAFFGHSLGSLLAFETARCLQRRAVPLPRRMLLAGCHAPRYRRTDGALHHMDDEALVSELRNYKGTPPEILAHRELLELVLPTVRADFALADNYRYQSGPPLPVPFSILLGKGDNYDAPEQVSGWQEESAEEASLHWFEGDHFFIHGCRDEVLARINKELTPLLPNPVLACA